MALNFPLCRLLRFRYSIPKWVRVGCLHRAVRVVLVIFNGTRMDYISGWCRSQRRLEGCTAIITGCNTGIGKETAEDLYLRGARVIMACRDVSKAEAAKKEIEQKSEDLKGTLVVENLNLSSLKSVRSFASRMLANESDINILINNAGVMCIPQGVTEDGFEIHIGTNHFGHALLTLLLLPRLISNAPSRIILVSSYAHTLNNLDLDDINFEKTSYNAFKAYCRSKAANVLFARILAQKLQEHNIKGVTTYSLHPGVIHTEIGRHFSSAFLSGTTWAFNNLARWFVKSSRCGAQTSIYCAVDDACAGETGLYYQDCAVTTPSQHCKDDSIAAGLWNITMERLNLFNYNPFLVN